MKKFTLILLIILPFVAQSQERYNWPPSVGIQLSYRASINTNDTPEGRQNAIAFASLPDFGITGYLPISAESPLGLIAGIGYSSYTVTIKDYNTGIGYANNINYLKMGADFYFASVTFGFALGLPMSAGLEGAELDTEIISMLSEFRIGWRYPVFQDESGTLFFVARGSYMLSGLYDGYAQNDPLKNIIPEMDFDPVVDSYNPRAASVSLGFGYSFNFGQ